MLALTVPAVVVAVQSMRDRQAPGWCVVVSCVAVAVLAAVWAWAIVDGVRDHGFGLVHVLSGALWVMAVGLSVVALIGSVLRMSPDRAISAGQNERSGE